MIINSHLSGLWSPNTVNVRKFSGKFKAWNDFTDNKGEKDKSNQGSFIS
ncbi:unnamed protein product [Gulo gulo]|uniref:Uncharacterized protein n=1 Tax=Gulo gulo TaxID=48420 RepID=A0A9X9MBE1_GULGU|nr:unnamed protein product [Gulo gulo]